MPEVLIKSRELSTAKGYWGYFEKWDSWSKKFQEVSTVPVEESFIILYLLSLLQTSKSYPASVRSSVFAIKYFHKLVGRYDFCNSEYVLEDLKDFVVITLKRKIFYSTTTPHITQIIRRRLYFLKSQNCVVVMCSKLYGFLSFSGVINLKCSDYSFEKSSYIYFY